MFNTACKDPLEAEKVGERRARKIKQSSDAIDSINDAVSKITMSTQTTRSSGVLSSVSSRSSRAPTSGSMSIRFGSTQPMHSSESYDNTGNENKPHSIKKHGKGRSRRRSFAGIGTNPFASHDGFTKHLSPEETWGPPSTASTTLLTPPHSSSGSSSTRGIDQTYTQTSHARLSTPADVSDPFVRFRRLLGRIEKASDHISATSLAEQWPEEYDDRNMAHEFEFERTLHALVRAQKLAAHDGSSGTAFPIPNRLQRWDVNKLAGANILHLGSVTGSPESWYLSTKYPLSILHSLGRKPLPFDLSSSSWGLPPNLLLEEWPEFPHLDYVDSIFDIVIIGHQLFGDIKCTLWPVLIDELARVLVPEGVLIVSTMDANPQRSGPILSSWIHQAVIVNVLRRFMVPQPSLLLPSWLEEDGHFEKQSTDRIIFPCGVALGLEPGTRDSANGTVDNGSRKRRKSYTSTLPIERLAIVSEEPDPSVVTGKISQRLAASWAGWRLYEQLYGPFLSLNPEKHGSCGDSSDSSFAQKWWARDESILRECRRAQPMFEMVTFIYRRIGE